MNDNIAITKFGKIKLSANISNQIIDLTSKVSWIQKENLKKDTSNKINPFLFTSILYEIKKSIDLLVKEYLSPNFSTQKYNEKFNLAPKNIIQDFIKDLQEYQNWNKLLEQTPDFTVLDTKKPSQIEEHKIELISTLINFATTIQEKYLNINYIADLSEALKELEIDLSYFLPKEEILLYKEKCEQALKNNDITSARNIINKIQELILNEWQKYPTNIDDFTNGKDFAFICHSTSRTDFTKFRAPYVSCSLFNNDIHTPYNSGFGFIMSPKCIVGANSHDMFIKNNATSEEDLQNFTSIPTINHPQRILNECLKRQNKNRKYNKFSCVYNEIVIKGFTPIAIFSLTNGAKELDSNYTNARKLQKYFPQLKIIDIDILVYGKGNELIKEQFKLIQSLEQELSKTEKHIKSTVNIDTLDKYELFFSQYSNLKSQKEYSTTEIMNIFNYNYNLINPALSNKEIFSGQYSDNEITYILRKNNRFNIDQILAKKFNYDDLMILIASLENDTKNLNKYFPGLEEFSKIASIAKPYILYEVQIEQLKNIEPLNFYTMSKYILDNILKSQSLNNIEFNFRKPK